MTTDRAKIVVFDVWFTDVGSPAANDEFRRAIKRNGSVVLAATMSSNVQPGLSQRSVLKPLSVFSEAASGTAEVSSERPGIVPGAYSSVTHF